MGAAKLLCVVLFFFAISAVQSDTLEAVLTAQGLNTMLGFLKGSGFISSIANVTLFVPTDNAFTANMPPQSDLPNVIRYHMVPGHILLQDLGDNQLFTTLFESRSVRTQIINLPGLNPAPKTVNGKVISAGDFISTEQNVVVHVIAGVLYPIPTQSIGEMLAGEPTLNITNNVVNQLKAVFDILNDTSRNLTLFAPTDDAWKAVDAKILQAINDHDLLVHLLSYHVVPDVIFSTYLPENMMFNATTLQGGSVTVVTSETGAVTINGVPLHSANALGTNGVYHSIDGILIPPFTVSDDLIYYNYTAFYAKLNSTDVFNTLLNVSAPALAVLALDDAAVAAAGDALTPDVLAYHIVIDSINDPTDHLQPLTLMALNGKPIFLSIIGDQKLVNGQTFTLVDKASNGFVASITSPLKPPAGSLLEALQDNPAVSSFVTIAKANNDVAAVLGNTSGLFTLFAPSNDALLKHPGLADLLTNATFVSQLLSLHVIPGVAFTKVVTTANSVASLEGTVLQFSVADNVLTVTGPQNAAMSVQTDIVATNGVAHIVDDVLLPTGFVDTTGAPTEAPTGSTDAPTDTPTGSTDAPTDTPTGSTDAPTDTPTVGTDAPTTAAPTTAAPTTAAPTTTTTKAPTTTTTTTTKSGASFAAPSFVLLAFLALFRLF